MMPHATRYSATNEDDKDDNDDNDGVSNIVSHEQIGHRSSTVYGFIFNLCTYTGLAILIALVYWKLCIVSAALKYPHQSLT